MLVKALSTGKERSFGSYFSFTPICFRLFLWLNVIVSLKQFGGLYGFQEYDTVVNIIVDGRNFEFVKSAIVVAGRNDKKQCKN